VRSAIALETTTLHGYRIDINDETEPGLSWGGLLRLRRPREAAQAAHVRVAEEAAARKAGLRLVVDVDPVAM